MSLGSLVIFYSYHTPVAFLQNKKLVALDVSVLTAATKRHVTTLEPDFNARINPAEFAERLKAAMLSACAEVAKASVK